MTSIMQCLSHAVAIFRHTNFAFFRSNPNNDRLNIHIYRHGVYVMIELTTIGSYMQILFGSNFPQFRLLSAIDFQRYLTQHGIKFSLKELEYYDKKEIIRPALRLRLYPDSRKEQRIIMKDTYTMKSYYNQNLIELPHAGDFQPWSTYGYGDKELTTELFYHPYQFVLVNQLGLGNNIKLTPLDVDEIQDFQQFVEVRRKVIIKGFKQVKMQAKIG
jgi:hypothetical protein